MPAMNLFELLGYMEFLTESFFIYVVVVIVLTISHVPRVIY
jgi:hypothetical protein